MCCQTTQLRDGWRMRSIKLWFRARYLSAATFPTQGWTWYQIRRIVPSRGQQLLRRKTGRVESKASEITKILEPTRKRETICKVKCHSCSRKESLKESCRARRAWGMQPRAWQSWRRYMIIPRRGAWLMWISQPLRGELRAVQPLVSLPTTQLHSKTNPPRLRPWEMEWLGPTLTRRLSCSRMWVPLTTAAQAGIATQTSPRVSWRPKKRSKPTSPPTWISSASSCTSSRYRRVRMALKWPPPSDHRPAKRPPPWSSRSSPSSSSRKWSTSSSPTPNSSTPRRLARWTSTAHRTTSSISHHRRRPRKSSRWRLRGSSRVQARSIWLRALGNSKLQADPVDCRL